MQDDASVQVETQDNAPVLIEMQDNTPVLVEMQDNTPVLVEMQDNAPVLVSLKLLKPGFENFEKITVRNQDFTIGRSLDNSVVIPFLSISRRHCIFKKTNDEHWIIEDCSAFGIEINGNKLGKGKRKKLTNKDVINMEPTEEFVYVFVQKCDQRIDQPHKRVKLENAISNDLINDVKLKFEASQSLEIKHIENKILNTKQLQMTSMKLKKQLQLKMDRKIAELEKNFALQINNLQGEKYEVERQETLLIEKRDVQLAVVREEMEEKILELMTQIKKHNETETELLNENSLLKDKLIKEREEFLSELNRESSSKQDLLENLKSKFKEQEEIRLKEKREFEEVLHKETERLRLAKEKELKELEEQNNLRESKLEQELNNIKKNLEEQIEQTEQQRMKTEQILTENMEQMKKLNDEEKMRTDQLIHEKEEIEKNLCEAKINAEKLLDEQMNRITEIRTELDDMMKKQTEQSGDLINSLQEELDRMKRQLQFAEKEKQRLLKISSVAKTEKEDKSDIVAVMSEIENIMDDELQCSICAELFIEAVTLNCTHTFCKYCITKWKNKKKNCAVCRAPITTECRSLSLDSFIEKMIENLTEEAKQKRQVLLNERKEEVKTLGKPLKVVTRKGRNSRRGGPRITSIASTSTTRNSTTTTLQPLPYRPAHMMDMMPLLSGGVADYSFRGGRARTTGATGAASTAARADTGRPDAPSSSHHLL